MDTMEMMESEWSSEDEEEQEQIDEEEEREPEVAITKVVPAARVTDTPASSSGSHQDAHWNQEMQHEENKPLNLSVQKNSSESAAAAPDTVEIEPAEPTGKSKKAFPEGSKRRGLMSGDLVRLFVRYLTTGQMPTDLELTAAKFEKTQDTRQGSRRHTGSDMPPNSKTGAKFKQWAKVMKVHQPSMELTLRGKVILPKERVHAAVTAAHTNNGLSANHLTMKWTIEQYSSRYTTGKLSFGITLSKLRKIIHKCPFYRCQAKTYLQISSITNDSSSDSLDNEDDRSSSNKEHHADSTAIENHEVINSTKRSPSITTPIEKSDTVCGVQTHPSKITAIQKMDATNSVKTDQSKPTTVGTTDRTRMRKADKCSIGNRTNNQAIKSKPSNHEDVTVNSVPASLSETTATQQGDTTRRTLTNQSQSPILKDLFAGSNVKTRRSETNTNQKKDTASNIETSQSETDVRLNLLAKLAKDIAKNFKTRRCQTPTHKDVNANSIRTSQSPDEKNESAKTMIQKIDTTDSMKTSSIDTLAIQNSDSVTALVDCKKMIEPRSSSSQASESDYKSDDSSLLSMEIALDMDGKSPPREPSSTCQNKRRTRGKKCVVPQCKSYQYDEDRNVTGIHFFQLPSNPQVVAVWEMALQMQGICSNPAARICDRHFKASDFDVTITGKVRRRQGSVPSIVTQENSPIAEAHKQTWLTTPRRKPPNRPAAQQTDNSGSKHYNLVDVSSIVAPKSCAASSEKPNSSHGDKPQSVSLRKIAPKVTPPKKVAAKTWEVPVFSGNISELGVIDTTRKKRKAPEVTVPTEDKNDSSISNDSATPGSGPKPSDAGTVEKAKSAKVSRKRAANALQKEKERRDFQMNIQNRMIEIEKLKLINAERELSIWKQKNLLALALRKREEQKKRDLIEKLSVSTDEIGQSKNSAATAQTEYHRAMETMRNTGNTSDISTFPGVQVIEKSAKKPKHKSLFHSSPAEDSHAIDTGGRQENSIQTPKADEQPCIDLTSHSNDSEEVERSAGNKPPPSEVQKLKPSKVLFRTRSGEIHEREINKELLVDILKKHNDRKEESRRTETAVAGEPAPKRIRTSDISAPHADKSNALQNPENSDGAERSSACISSLYQELLHMIGGMGQEIPQVMTGKQTNLDILQRRLSLALTQVKKCKEILPKENSDQED